MQDDSQQELEQLISEGQSLLENYQREKVSLKSPGAELGDFAISEIAGAFISDLSGSGRLGRKARGTSRAYLKSGKRNQLQELDDKYLQQANRWISKVSSFLGHVSTKTSTKRQNSPKLLSKFSKVERVVRPDTKLRNGIGILKEFALQGIVKNEVLAKSKPKGLVVRPGEQFTAFTRLLEIASRAVEYLIVVDPYPSHETLIVLKKSPRNQPAMLLTHPPQDKEKRSEFEVLVKRLKKDRPEIDTRYTPNFVLHDRFILTKTEAWHVGQSIKDIGNKLSAITPMNLNEKSRLESEFNKLWNESIPV